MTEPRYPLSQAHRLTGMAVRRLGRGAVGWSQILYRRTLADLPDARIEDDGIVTGWCTPEHLDQIRDHPEGRAREVHDRRVASGDRCHFLSVNGRIACTNWITLTRGAALCGQDPEIRFMSLEPGQCFTYDLYTYQDFRKRGLGRLLKHRLIQAVRDEGFHMTFGMVDPRNIPSSRLHLRLGYTPVKEVYLYRIGRKCYAFQRPVRQAVTDWFDYMRNQLR